MSGGSQTSFNSLYKGKYCLRHPDSVFKAAWDWLILAFVIYTAIVIPYDVAFVTPTSAFSVFFLLCNTYTSHWAVPQQTRKRWTCL